MATYATLDDVAAYVIGTVEITDEDMAERLLEQCERELDSVLIRNTWSFDDALRIDPSILIPFQVVALNRATCAQFEYHRTMGEDFFVKPQPVAVRQPEGGGYEGRLQFISPKSFRELDGKNLLQVMGDVSGDEGWGASAWMADPFYWQRNWEPMTFSAARSYSTISYRR